MITLHLPAPSLAALLWNEHHQFWLQIVALPLIEWVDYRMRDERQRAIYTDSGYPFSLAGV